MDCAASDVALILESLVCLTSQSLGHTDLQEHFQIVKTLGRGAFGSVLMVKDRKTEMIMALKVLEKGRSSQRSFLTEFCVSFFLSSHPNIIGSYGLAFQTCDHYVFAQELSPIGDLLSLIPDQVGLPEVTVKRCAVQISSVLEFMESKGLVHRDIKPENILVFDKGCHCIKLSDFGFTCIKGTVIKPTIGTVTYMPPELCQLTHKDHWVADFSLDVWAFGVLLFCLITGGYPWQMANFRDRKYSKFYDWQSRRLSLDPPPPWNRFPSGLLKMFRNILAIESKDRRKASEILMHMDEPWKTDTNY